MNARLYVDGEEIALNDFAMKMLSGTVAGAMTSLRGIKRDCKEIEVKVTE